MKPILSGKPLRFAELEERFGRENADTILLTLERLEGVREHKVGHMTAEQRLSNVLALMAENFTSGTKH